MCNIGEKPREGGGSRGSRACNGNVAESHPLASVEICGVPGQGRSPFGFNCKRGDDLLPNPRASYPQGEETRDEGIARKKRKKEENKKLQLSSCYYSSVSRIGIRNCTKLFVLFFFFLELKNLSRSLSSIFKELDYSRWKFFEVRISKQVLA